MANEVQPIERRQRVPVRDAAIVQGTGKLHHPIGDPFFGEPKNSFDNSATLDSGKGVFDFHARAGEPPMEYLIATAEFLTFGLFLAGWRLHPRARSPESRYLCPVWRSWEKRFRPHRPLSCSRYLYKSGQSQSVY